MNRLALITCCLFLASCEAVKNRLDLWFVVPKNPFEQPEK